MSPFSLSSAKRGVGRRVRSGFSLIELLVAITITAAITVLMVAIVMNVLSVWGRSTATLSTGNQARLIFDQLTLDFQGAVLRRSSDVMLAATIPADQRTVNAGRGDANEGSAQWNVANSKPGDSAAPNGSLELNPANRQLENYRFGQAGVWLRLFAIPSDNSSALQADASAPRAVAYQIMRRQVGSVTAPYTYQLFRTEVRPAGDNAADATRSTFGQGYDLFGANGYNDPTDATNGGAALADPGVIRRPRSEYVMGDGIIDFGVRFFTTATNGTLEEAFPVDRRGGGATGRRVFAATTDTTKLHPAVALPSGNFTAALTSYGYPSAVEFMVRILTPEGIQIIQAYETDPTRFGGASASKWWELAEANSKVYVRRIEIKANAL